MGLSKSTESVESAGLGMGTGLCHKAYGKNAEKALQAVGAEVKRLERLLSRFAPESDIAKINRLAGRGEVELSPEAFEVLALAGHFSGLCRDAFDVTVGPLVELWDYKNAAAAPDRERIREALSLVNHADLRLNPASQTAGLRRKGQSVDLGAIGKGYASDKLLGVFRRFGVTSAFSNLGGNVAVLGTKPDGSPWRVGIRHPRRENRLIGAVDVIDKAVVTSGDDQRYFIDALGIRRHHLLDPSTGYPADAGLISVTIVADSTAAADALSTAVFVAGMERGRAILRSFPGAEAVIVDHRLQVYVTRGLNDCFLAAEGTAVVMV
ncbi:FAD:protein FMN transferase [Paenibacillus oralis]|uniref:FAD:protein FMN transferase n=1 Tax=Paenibacillus oralis TaxID=2490856 RepID=A0A3P3U3P0_9BACL|nr:FAD:protein FMN transferase [Paenibacillus oralis]RRJ64764.1 FAD:protein FMN transferase [Paenibacillus oralis]